MITATDALYAQGAIALDVSNQPITFDNVTVISVPWFDQVNQQPQLREIALAGTSAYSLTAVATSSVRAECAVGSAWRK